MGGVWDRGRVRRGEGLHGSNKCNGKFAFAGHGAVRNESRGGEKGAKGELLTFFLYLADIFPPSRRDKFVSRHHHPSLFLETFTISHYSLHQVLLIETMSVTRTHYENFDRVLKTREK